MEATVWQAGEHRATIARPGSILKSSNNLRARLTAPLRCFHPNDITSRCDHETVGVFALNAAASLAQQTVGESIEVRVMNVDVVVRDRAVKPVTGLTKDDSGQRHNGVVRLTTREGRYTFAYLPVLPPLQGTALRPTLEVPNALALSGTAIPQKPHSRWSLLIRSR